MIEIYAYVLSATSALMLWLMGSKSKWGPRVGLINQVLWIVYTVITKQWGLLPGTLIYTFIHLRNAINWERKSKNV
jgi:hypothetical protein